jgi:hypothetical protein
MARVIFLLLLLSLALPGGPRTGKPPDEIPVTVLFRDFAGDAVTPPDHMKSDGKGTYSNGVDNVEAVFMSSGNLRLITNISRNPPIRTLLLDLRYPAIGIGANLKPFEVGLTQGDMENRIMISDCSSPFSSTGLKDLPLGGTVLAAVKFTFPDPNNTKMDWSVRRGHNFSQ